MPWKQACSVSAEPEKANLLLEPQLVSKALELPALGTGADQAQRVRATTSRGGREDAEQVRLVLSRLKRSNINQVSARYWLSERLGRADEVGDQLRPDSAHLRDPALNSLAHEPRHVHDPIEAWQDLALERLDAAIEPVVARDFACANPFISL
jgi:hypothetical protein